MLIYWSGAAIALMADAELRRLSDSAESLDTVLARLQACCLPSERSWSGEEFFAKLDELSKYPVFEDLYRRYAHNRGMPPLDDLYNRLGVVSTGASTVRLSDKATDAKVRMAIMGT
jgi:predicted metalloprotease with PDZ domain